MAELKYDLVTQVCYGTVLEQTEQCAVEGEEDYVIHPAALLAARVST